MKFKFLFILLVSTLLASCKLTGIKGNGDVISEIRAIEDFNRIDVSGNFDVEVQVGEPLKIEILAESNLMKYIKTKVRNNTLYIMTKENLRPRDDLKIIISVAKLEAIECSGVNDVIAQGVSSDKFEIDLSGAASIKISGNANRLYIDVSGAADLLAKELITEDIRIDVSGAANAEIHASNSCDANVSGAGYIELYGSAQDVNMNISGAGSLERK